MAQKQNDTLELAAHLYLEKAADPTKPTLVLLAGLGCDHAFWQPLMPDLEPNYNCILFDNPGTGASPARMFFSIHDIADAVLARLDATGIEDFLILAHSMGGFVAQTLAARAPDRVKAMVVLSSGMGGPHHDSTRQRLMKDYLRFWPILFKRWKQGSDMFYPLLFTASSLQQQTAMFYSFLSYCAQRRRWLARFSHLLCGSGFSGHMQAHRIKAPTLVIHGSDDRVFPARDGLALARTVKHGHFVQVTAGHILPYEVPELSELINGYLLTREVPSAALLTGLDAPMSRDIRAEEEADWCRMRLFRNFCLLTGMVISAGLSALTPQAWKHDPVKSLMGEPQ